MTVNWRICYEIRPLKELPWPHGLGKQDTYPRLERRLHQLLGEQHREPRVHEEAFHTSPDYRLILKEELDKAPWTADILDCVWAATELAAQAPLLGKTLPSTEEWRSWAQPLRGRLHPRVFEWLTQPATVGRDSQLFGNGRHRITYLRLHWAPEQPILVETHG